MRAVCVAATLFGTFALLPGPAAAEFEPAAAQARVEAALGEPFSAASVGQVAEAVAGIVAGLPPAELQQSIDLVGGVASLMPDRAAAARVAEAARGAAEKVAKAHPEVIEDWWADIIADSITMAADEAYRQSDSAPAQRVAENDAKPVGFSFDEAQSKVAARLGEPIADAAPDRLGRAVAAEIAALPPGQIEQSITIAGAVAAKLTNPAAMRAVADSAAAAVEQVAADNPGAVPDWRKDGIVESIGLFVGLETDAPAAAPPSALPKPTYSVADGDLTIVPEPAARQTPAPPDPEPEQAEAPPPAEVRAAGITPDAKPDTVPVPAAAAEPLADAATQTAMRPPKARAGRMEGSLPRPEEIRALLRDQGLPATAQNLNRAMATLLSGRDAMAPAPAGGSCDGLDLSGLRAAAGAGRCTAEYAEALALIQPAAGADTTRRRPGLRDREDWWRDPGSNDSREVAGNDASDDSDRDPPGGGGAGGADDIGNGGANDGGGGGGGDSGENGAGGSENGNGSGNSGNGNSGNGSGNSGNGNSGNGSGNSGNGNSGNDSGNSGNGNGGNDNDGNDNGGNNNGGNGNGGNGNNGNSDAGNGNRGDDDRGRGDDDDDGRGRGGGRGDRDDDRGGLGSAVEAVGDAVGGLLD